MSFSRRGFIAGMAGLLVSARTALGQAADGGESVAFTGVAPHKTTYLSGTDIILPPALKKGSIIAVTAPAKGGVSDASLDSFIALMRSLGCIVLVGATVDHRHGYLSAPDPERAAEFMDFVKNPDVSCIVCARGGYGAMRILSMIDFELVRQNPKIIIGYSDITALINAIFRLSRIVAYHGPVASSSFDAFTTHSFVQTLFGIAEPERVVVSEPRMTVHVPGVAEGRLVGGNLTMITSTLGTPFEVNTKGKLLLLEDVQEEPYKLDRMLTQLLLAGKLEDAAGIVVGNFRHHESNKASHYEIPTVLKQVLLDRLSSLTIPVVSGLAFGHVRSKVTLGIGVSARLDTEAKTLTMLDPTVAA